jgi:hypothetical protein
MKERTSFVDDLSPSPVQKLKVTMPFRSSRGMVVAVDTRSRSETGPDVEKSPPREERKPGAASLEIPYVPGDVIPLPETIESDGESVWAAWEEAAAEAATPFADTVPIQNLSDDGG